MLNALMLGLALLTLLPLAVALSWSFKPLGEIFHVPVSFIPLDFTLDNYINIFTQAHFERFFRNSIVVAFGYTTLGLLWCSMGGWALSQYRSRLYGPFLVLLFAVIALPFQVVIVSAYVLMAQIGLVDTLLALIVPFSASAYGILFMRQYMLSLPREVFESARLDGAGEFRIWFRMAVPMSMPGMAALGIFLFLDFVERLPVAAHRHDRDGQPDLSRRPQHPAGPVQGGVRPDDGGLDAGAHPGDAHPAVLPAPLHQRSHGRGGTAMSASPTVPAEHPQWDPAELLRPLPAGFTFGAATSAYQIEGSPAADGKGESIWDRFVRQPGAVADASSGDVAADHYRRWPEDVALMCRLGLDAYRFSVAWTRIIPDGTGPVEPRGLDFYSRLVDALLEAGIEPWLTLYHWDLPQALEDGGGWPVRATAEAFERYADVVSRALGDRVSRWLTLNEPWEVAFLGYHLGVHAPGRHSLRDALAAVHVQLLAHGRAVPVIRANSLGARVGIVLDPSPVYPATPDPRDVAAAMRMDGHINRWFLDPVFGRGYPADMLAVYGSDAPDVLPGDLGIIGVGLDMLGLNEYFPLWIADDPTTPPLAVRSVIPADRQLTAMGWPVDPNGLYESLVAIAHDYPRLPLVLTESGAAFEDVVGQDGRVDDRERLGYHASHIAAVGRAVEAGAPVSGYFAWSLLDNFEWAMGLSRRFGIVALGASGERIPKASGEWYAQLLAARRSGWR